MMIVLIYSFVSTVFRTEQRRKTQGRVYEDYSDYRHNSTYSSSPESFTPLKRSIYRSAHEAKEIKRKIFSGVVAATVKSYNVHNSQFPKPAPIRENPGNQQYQEMLKHAKTPVPEYQSALQFFASEAYESALQKLDDAMNSLDQMDLTHRIDIYKMMAECYLKLKNDDGYIQNRIRQVRMERRKAKILQDSFPERVEFQDLPSWLTTAEASKNLLRMRTVINRNDNRTTREMLKRAELDLEVARKVTQ